MIGDEVAAALPQLQAQAESLMTDHLLVQVLGKAQFDPASGGSSRPVLSIPYDGPGRVRVERQEAVQDVADDSVTVQRFLVSVPVDVTTVRKGHQVTVAASRDAGMVGQVLYIKAVQGGSQVVQRRFVATDQQ